MSDILRIGKYEFNSRLIVGSGKYDSFQTTLDATLASGSELITVAVRRVNITNPGEENLMTYFKDTNVKFLPCLLYTSPSPRDRTRSRMPSSA